MSKDDWPELSYEDAKETYKTVHLWTQIVGKIKLAKLPWINHSWHVTLLVTPLGLTTGDLADNGTHFQINFNFLQHRLQILTSKNQEKEFSLKSLSVASFYNQIRSALIDFGIEFEIHLIPNEIDDVIPFPLDNGHATYNPEHASNLHRALLKANEIFFKFRSEFIGKCSPVHFFWGGFDLAVSRFSGEKAPLHPGGVPNLPDWVAQEAYSHEVSSCGFWPGNDAFPYAAFYSYIYPEPANFMNSVIKPQSAFYHQDLREFLLPYQDVQQAPDPAQMVLDFLHSTYEAAATLSHWNRNKLENKYERLS